MNKPLIIVGGPTASGKSDTAVSLAGMINGSVISADSMQAYKKMDIGTAKVSEKEMAGIKHYGIDILEPSMEYSVSDFKEMAFKAIDEIYANGHIPVITGGTGFYIQAVLYDIDFNKDAGADDRIRDEQNGKSALHDMLKGVDPKSAEAIHENNVKRVIRAIEYFRMTGNKISDHNETERAKESPYDYLYFALTWPREILYERIDKRVDIMMDNGLLKETEELYKIKDTLSKTAREAIGYREMFEYYDGTVSLEEAVSNIKLNSRHYAKRQETWLRREKNVIFIDRSSFNSAEETAEYMYKNYVNKLLQKND